MIIPSSLFINDSHHDAKPYCDYIKSLLPKKMSSEIFNYCISLYLLKHRNDSSYKLSSYFSLLPKNFSSFPFFFTSKTLKALENSFFINNVYDDIEILDDAHRYLKKAISKKTREGETGFKGLEDVKKSDFLKAFFTVNSRNVFVEELKKKSLIPVLDFINHDSSNKNVSYYYDKDHKGLVVKATRNIQKGEEILMDYGVKGNHQFLQNYGFTVDKPDKDTELIIKLESENDVVFKKKNNFILDNSWVVSKSDKNPMHSLILLNFFLQDAILKYPSTLVNDKKKMREAETMKAGELNILRVLNEEKDIIYSAFDTVNALIFLLTTKDVDPIKKTDYIKEDEWKTIDKYRNDFRKEADQHRVPIYPVTDYSIFKREDIHDFLINIDNWVNSRKLRLKKQRNK